ncbi:MAG TPA: hypothetical protein VMT73_05495 [Anaerolineales bacterium]|nr:hypothetical protein [Anaerolineales bacterium]
MNKTDFRAPVVSLDSVSLSTEPTLSTERKLIVVIPNVEEETELARRILAIARPLSLKVLLLGFYSRPDEEAELRRKLITMSAFIREGGLVVGIQNESGRDWLEKVKAIWKPCDMLACYIEQPTSGRQRPMNEILASDLNTSVYIFKPSVPLIQKQNKWINQIISWFGSLVIITSFFWLQVKISQPAQDAIRTIFMIFSIFIEVGLLFVWNSFTA